MKTIFHGDNVEHAMTLATGRALGPAERKQAADVYAPPLDWGPWVEIFAQFGIVGSNNESHITRLNISFDTISQVPSTFDVEIRGGDELARTIGPGSAVVTITGNVATAITIRAKSHLTAQAINVYVG